MVRERTPARSSASAQIKNQLGSSWVVGSESDGDDEYTPPNLKPANKKVEAGNQTQKRSEPTQPPRRRNKPSTRSSAEPELVMPSLYRTDLGASWQAPDRVLSRSPDKDQIHASKSEHQHRLPQPAKTREDHMMETYLIVADFGKRVLLWIFDLLGRTLNYVKTPLAMLFAAWLVIGFIAILRNILFSSFYSALSPICRVPGTQYLNLPMCHPAVTAEYSGEEPPPVEFDKLMTVQNKFDAVMQEAAGGASLPHDMKRGETSIRDLRQIVRYSQLHSKNELVLEFDGFLETARMASRDLQKFNSHVGRGVDNILATARWTKRVLDGIAEQDASQGAVTWFVNDKLLAPFQPLKFTENTVLEQYIRHTRVVEEEINRLVSEAQALLQVLQNLEDRLDVIHGIAVHDNIHVEGSKAELLSQLWTTLGGNRSQLGKFESQLALLRQVDVYRRTAIAHVTGTIVRLQGMGTELEELRERVGGVELLGAKGAVPLSVHIENIELGVERLERGRRGARELENQETNRHLNWRNAGDARAIEGGPSR